MTTTVPSAPPNDSSELVSIFQTNRIGSDTWSCPIPIEVFSSPHPNIAGQTNYDPTKPVTQPMNLDIITTLGHSPKRNVTGNESYTAGAFYLPPKYNSQEAEADVDIYIRRACALSLVEVVANGNRKPSKNTTHTLTIRRYFCRCGIPPTKTQGKMTTHHHRTHRLSVGHLCSFKFNCCFDPNTSRWFFPATQSSSPLHKHHHQKTSIGSINFPTADIDKHKMRTLMQMVALNFQLSQIKSWFNVASELNLTPGQVRGLYNLFKEGRFRHPTIDGMVGASKNNIETLIESMSEDPNISALWISSRKEDATSLITVKTSKKRRAHDKLVLDSRLNQTQNQDTVTDFSLAIDDEDYDSSHLHPKEESPVTHTERILKSLQLEQANRVLLSLAWMDHDALKEIARFPFVLGMDETDRTNCEERPLFCMVGLNADHKIIPVLHILMPSKARWAYNWIYTEAIPHLLPYDVRKNVQMLLTDQGKELVHMLEATRDSSVFSKCCSQTMCLAHC
mmetsp:Transcript_41263/g.98800  ORF Transcript_41263/g.98800 Transcript_41263/m.98800 type:complete len:507 (+) Transcript_41263:375-1895(+)